MVIKKKYGVLEQKHEGGRDRIIWAYDQNEDDFLDTYYTLNEDGSIHSGPAPLSPSVSIDRVRAVKIWLLMRSRKRKNKLIAEAGLPAAIPGKTGAEELDSLDSAYVYRLYTTTVKLRNMYYR